MYKVTGWIESGHAEQVFLETWEDVLMLFSFLQEGQYRSILVVNCASGKAVLEMTL